MTQDWRFDCDTALKRASHEDLGAVAAKEGILGLPLSVSSKKAQRVYDAATAARNTRQNWLARRKQKPIPEGSTGFKDLDAAFAEVQCPALV